MKRTALLLCLLALAATSVCAQDVPLPKNLRSARLPAKPGKQKAGLFVGGNISTDFGTRVSIAPEFGVRPEKADMFNFSVSPRYEIMYSRQGVMAHNGGVSVQTGLVVLGFLTLDIGYEYTNYLNIPVHGVPAGTSQPSRRSSLHALLLAFGYEYDMDGHLSLYAKYALWPIHSKFVDDPAYEPYCRLPLPMSARFGLRYYF